MSNLSRRQLLHSIGTSLAIGAAGEYVLAAQDVQHVHEAVTQERAVQKKYTPKALNAHEYATLQRLSDLVIPADEHAPGALAANSADFIDFLCSGSDDMKRIYTGGIGWLDESMKHRHEGKSFVDCTPDQQTALLDLIAYRENRDKDASLGPGIDFFTWARKMIADAYFTHPLGVKFLGYMGNTAVSHFSVPQEAIDYAIKRSPFA